MYIELAMFSAVHLPTLTSSCRSPLPPPSISHICPNQPSQFPLSRFYPTLLHLPYLTLPFKILPSLMTVAHPYIHPSLPASSFWRDIYCNFEMANNRDFRSLLPRCVVVIFIKLERVTYSALANDAARCTVVILADIAFRSIINYYYYCLEADTIFRSRSV